MNKSFAAILFLMVLVTGCKKNSENNPPTERSFTEKELSGTYEGYKFFNKSDRDSLAVTIKVDWVSNNKLALEEIKPFKHTKQLQMTGMDFIFDRGTGEDECGRISMKGTGRFEGSELYVIETITCIKGNAPDKFVEYHVSKI